jgi:hypothetical protein
MASHSMERIGAEQSANALVEFSRPSRGQAQEFAEDYHARDVGAIRGFTFVLLFEGLVAIVAIALFAWVH